MKDFLERVNSMCIDIALLLHGQNTLHIQILQKEKKIRIKELEKRVNVKKMTDNLFIFGFNVQYKSYARSVFS